MTVTLMEIAFCVILAYLAWIYLKDRNLKMPPGPPKLPVVGNLHLLGGKPHETFMALREKYGDFYSFQFGSYRGVVVNGSKALREVLVEMSTSGRHIPSQAFPRTGGIVMNEGKTWVEQRRFTLKTLRDMGFGKKSIEETVKQEIAELLDSLAALGGEPNDLNLTFNAAVLNVLWMMIAGHRFKHQDPELLRLISLLNAATGGENFTFVDGLSFFVSWMKPFQYLSNFKRHVRHYMKASFEMFDKAIKEHEEAKKYLEDPSDYIDLFLKEIAETKDPNSTFYGDEGILNLKSVLFDLFIAGTETTTTTIVYTMQYMAKYPEIQDRMHSEIKAAVGHDRMPSLADRPSLPYTEAVILEVLRASSLLPRSLLHKTTTTYKYGDWEIPPDTLVIPNLYSAHYDRATWGDPEAFRPERFLIFNEDGSIASVNKHPESLLPFSFGKRICLGETLARDQLTLFISAVFQRFKIRAAEEPFEIERFVTPITIPPVPKKLVLQERV